MTDTAHTLRPLGWTTQTGARVTAHLHFRAALNRRKGRGLDLASGVAEQFTWPESADGWSGNEIVIPSGLDTLGKHAATSRYLVDDGQTMRLFYVAGWHDARRYVALKTLTPGAPGMWPVEDHGPLPLLHLLVHRTVTEE